METELEKCKFHRDIILSDLKENRKSLDEILKQCNIIEEIQFNKTVDFIKNELDLFVLKFPESSVSYGYIYDPDDSCYIHHIDISSVTIIDDEYVMDLEDLFRDICCSMYITNNKGLDNELCYEKRGKNYKEC